MWRDPVDAPGLGSGDSRPVEGGPTDGGAERGALGENVGGTKPGGLAPLDVGLIICPGLYPLGDMRSGERDVMV